MPNRGYAPKGVPAMILGLGWVALFGLLCVVEVLDSRANGRDLRRRGRWAANLALIVIGIGVAASLPISAFSMALWAEAQGFGLLRLIGAGSVVSCVVSALVLSLWVYVYHRASHEIPFLWRFHQVHHSDDMLDASTAFRTHPIHMAINIGVTSALVAAIGMPHVGVLIYFCLVFVIELTHHMSLSFPASWDRILRRVVLTPALHHIHHSDYARETDTNYGVDLVIWDKLFGTYLDQPKRDAAAFRLGLKEYPTERADNLDELLFAGLRRDPKVWPRKSDQ